MKKSWDLTKVVNKLLEQTKNNTNAKQILIEDLDRPITSDEFYDYVRLTHSVTFDNISWAIIGYYGLQEEIDEENLITKEELEILKILIDNGIHVPYLMYFNLEYDEEIDYDKYKDSYPIRQFIVDKLSTQIIVSSDKVGDFLLNENNSIVLKECIVRYIFDHRDVWEFTDNVKTYITESISSIIHVKDNLPTEVKNIIKRHSNLRKSHGYIYGQLITNKINDYNLSDKFINLTFHPLKGTMIYVPRTFNKLIQTNPRNLLDKYFSEYDCELIDSQDMFDYLLTIPRISYKIISKMIKGSSYTDWNNIVITEQQALNMISQHFSTQQKHSEINKKDFVEFVLSKYEKLKWSNFRSILAEEMFDI